MDYQVILTLVLTVGVGEGDSLENPDCYNLKTRDQLFR